MSRHSKRLDRLEKSSHSSRNDTPRCVLIVRPDETENEAAARQGIDIKKLHALETHFVLPDNGRDRLESKEAGGGAVSGNLGEPA